MTRSAQHVARTQTLGLPQYLVARWHGTIMLSVLYSLTWRAHCLSSSAPTAAAAAACSELGLRLRGDALDFALTLPPLQGSDALFRPLRAKVQGRQELVTREQHGEVRPACARPPPSRDVSWPVVDYSAVAAAHRRSLPRRLFPLPYGQSPAAITSPGRSLLPVPQWLHAWQGTLTAAYAHMSSLLVARHLFSIHSADTAASILCSTSTDTVQY